MRLVQMRGVDLAQFQFDFDLTWAAFFLNADGTVYGRFGTGDPETDRYFTMPALRRALERVLEIHRDYPGNRALFDGKRGDEPRWRWARDLPLRETRKLSGRVTMTNCVHCHELHDAMHLAAVREGDRDPRRVQSWFPTPDRIGLTIDPDHGTRIADVVPGSASAGAGLRAGDVLMRLGGQLVLSVADIQWVLHHQPDRTTLRAAVQRGGEPVSAELALAGDWKLGDISWRASMYSMVPEAGLWLDELDAGRREELGLEEGRLGLLLKGTFKPPARRSGLRKGDVIVGVDGLDRAMTAQQLHAYIRLTHWREGSKLKVDVMRGGKRKQLVVAF